MELYIELANLLRLLLMKGCFSNVRCTEAEDVALYFGTCRLPGFYLKEVRRARLEVLYLNAMSETTDSPRCLR